MVKLTVFLKFTKTEEGNKLTHSGNQIFKSNSLSICKWCVQEEIREFVSAGWKLEEERIVSVTYIGD